MVQVQFYNNSGLPYTQSDFNLFAANHFNAVELVIPWTLETAPGTYDFSQLDQYMGYAETAGLAVVVVFWYYGWTFGVTNWVPSWITSREIYLNGAVGLYPPWWNASARSDYFGFINATVEHLDPDPNFQGVYAPFGDLDFPWGWPPTGGSGAAVAGYSPDTVRAYDSFLATQYQTLAHYNSIYGTSYTSWFQIPAPAPNATGEWNDFGNFRIYSVEQTYGLLSEYVRAATNRTIFYYYGGSIGSTVVGGDLEDVYFSLAAQYGGIVNVDDADVQLYPMLFASLAEKYDVRYIQEFTPPTTGFYQAFNETMANIYVGRPWEVGADFFTYNTASSGFMWAFSFFGRLANIAEPSLPGESAGSSTAALLCYYPGFYGFANNTLATNVLPDEELLLLNLSYLDRPFTIVTDLELMNEAVNLSAFATVLDISDAFGNTTGDPYIQGDLEWFVTHGGDLVDAAGSYSFLDSQAATVLADLSPTPTWSQIDLQETSSSVQPELFLSANNWDFFESKATAETGTLEVALAPFDLPTSGSFLVNDLLAGTHSDVSAVSGTLAIPWDPASGEVDFFQVVPAVPGPSVTSFVASPSVLTESGSTTLSVAATGGTTPYTYAYEGLPAGCTSSDTDSLVCSPTAVGTFTIFVTVSDAAERQVTATAELVVHPLPTISSFLVAPSTVAQGNATSFSVSAAGGTTPYSFRYTGLPLGCASSNTSLLTCVPRVAGAFTVTVIVTDARSMSANASTDLIVLPLSYFVTFSQTGLPPGTNWSVSFAGTAHSATGISLVWAEPNGSYPFAVGTVVGYEPTLPNGTVTVQGANVTESIGFQPIPGPPLTVPGSSPSEDYGLLVELGVAAAGAAILIVLLRYRRRRRTADAASGPAPPDGAI